ncbi:MAG: ExeM/NucH family extracellular endonuclease [Pseudomonadota bacterium]
MTACSGPTPRCGDDFTSIAQIQGRDQRSPLEGARVETEGIVTALRFGNDRTPEGFYIESTKPDGDPATSDGLFVAGPGPTPGTLIRIAGTVAEVNDQLTALSPAQVTECGAGELPPPSPVVLPLRGRHIESLEGTRISLTGTHVLTGVTRLNTRGEAVVANGTRLYGPTEVASPGRFASEVARANLRRSLTLDDFDAPPGATEASLWPDPAPAVGTQLDNLTGVLEHQYGYRLHLTKAPAIAERVTLPEPPSRRGNLRVVAFNVENLFNGDGQGRDFPTPRGRATEAGYRAQLSRIANHLAALTPDMAALAELENDGSEPGSALADLLAALQEASGHPYRGVATPAGGLGDDAIAVGIIYREDTVEPVGEPSTRRDAPFSDLNRPPLAQTFRHRASGETLTLVSLHLKSKSCGEAIGPDADQRDGQGCWNATRTQAVRALGRWIDQTPEADTRRTLLAGDLNAYSREAPLKLAQDLGYQRVLPPSPPTYTYVFRGAAGSLDHILAGPDLASQLKAASVWHINADRPAVPSESENLSLRSSDHDPVVADFLLEPR